MENQLPQQEILKSFTQKRQSRNEHLENIAVLFLHIAHIQQENKPMMPSNLQNYLVTVKTPHHEQEYIKYPEKINN